MMPIMKRNLIFAAVPAVLVAGCFLFRWPSSGSKDLRPSEYQHQPQGAKDVIVFMHGLYGGRDGTWTSEDSVDFRTLLKTDTTSFETSSGRARFSDLAIFSVSYYSPFSGEALGPPDLAVRVAQQLGDRDVFMYDRVHFVTHSMGGVVVKELLMNMKTMNDANLDRVRSVLLIASPAQGSNLANYASKIPGLSKKQVSALQTIAKNDFLQSQHIRWEGFISDGRHQGLPRVYCAYEGQRTYGEFVVTRDQAKTTCDDTQYGMDTKDHAGTVKPSRRSDDPYVWVTRRIRQSLEYKAGAIAVDLAPQSLHSALQFLSARTKSVMQLGASCTGAVLNRGIRGGQYTGTVPELMKMAALDMAQPPQVSLEVDFKDGVYDVGCK